MNLVSDIAENFVLLRHTRRNLDEDRQDFSSDAQTFFSFSGHIEQLFMFTSTVDSW